MWLFFNYRGVQGYFASYFCMCTTLLLYVYNLLSFVHIQKYMSVYKYGVLQQCWNFFYILQYDIQKYDLAVFRWAYCCLFIEKVTLTLIFVTTLVMCCVWPFGQNKIWNHAKVQVWCKSKSYTYFCTRTTSYKSTTVWTHLVWLCTSPGCCGYGTIYKHWLH